MAMVWDFSLAGVLDRCFVGNVEVAEIWLGDNYVWPPPMPTPPASDYTNSSPTVPPTRLPLTRNVIVWDPMAWGAWKIDYYAYLYDATTGTVLTDPIGVDAHGNALNSTGGAGAYNAGNHVEWRGPWPFPAGHIIQVRCGYFGPGVNDPVWQEYEAQHPTAPVFDLFAVDQEAMTRKEIVNGGLPWMTVTDGPQYMASIRRPLRWNMTGATAGFWKPNWELFLQDGQFGGAEIARWNAATEKVVFTPPPGWRPNTLWLFVDDKSTSQMPVANIHFIA